jgi:hypothetical protein
MRRGPGYFRQSRPHWTLTEGTHVPPTGSSTMGTARDLNHAHVVGSRERCQSRTEADGKSVTESNLRPGAPAQNIRRSARPGRRSA